MKIFFKIGVFVLCLFLSQKVYAYKVNTHQIITLIGTEKSGGFNNFVLDFGEDPGLAMGHAMFGSIAEDHADFFFRRYTYHFYDPENEKGLGTLDPAFKWGFSHDTPFNEFSYTEARKAQFEFFIGRDHETREDNRNFFFRSLGHIVHLIQDMAQPSHARDDPHASHFESVGGAFILNPSQLEEWALFSGSDVLSFANSQGVAKPLQSFEHPFRALASFSNRNFFSDDTIFKDYPQPAEEDTNYTEDFIPWGIGEVALVEAEDGHVDEVSYIVKTRGAYAGVKLAQVGYFGDRLHEIQEARLLAFQIDDEVARENAEVLIPLAVEYSAGLLDYFFRGDIDAEADGADGLKITNNSPEAMDGTFALYYDNKNEERYPVEGAEWFFSLGPEGISDRKTFVPPEDSKEPGKYVLVFKGKMGQEGSVDGAEGFAVTGKNIQLIDVNYLFIIPETVELLGSPSLEISDSGMVDCSYYEEGVGWKTTSIWKHARNTFKWNLGAQRIEGKFVQFGSAYIARIRLATFVGSTNKVFLDGAEVDPVTWRGEPGKSPTTWAMESGGSYYSSPTFVVELSDGQVFGTPMVFYETVAESYSRSESCGPEGSHFLGSGSGKISIEARAVGYQVKYMSGAPYDKSRGGTYCVPELDFDREQHSYCFIVTTATFPDLIWVLSTDFLTSEPGLGYFPRLEKSVIVEFITPPYVAERIKALGIKPIDFIVEMN